MKLPTLILALFLAPEACASDLVFPQFVNGELAGILNRTRLILTNNSAVADSGTIRFLRPDGTDLQIPIGGQTTASLPYSVAPWGTLDLVSDGTGPLAGGAIEVQSTNPAPGLQGMVIYDVIGHRVSVTASVPSRMHTIYTSITDTERTAVAIYNPSPVDPAHLRLTLLDSLGQQQASKEIDLLARTQLARFVDEPALFGDALTPQSIPFKGSLIMEVTSGAAITATALIQDRTTGALVGIPASAARFASASGKQILDAGGNPIRLRGMNLGGWLVPEGYIVKVPGYGSPASIRQRIEALLGPAETEKFYQKYQASYVTEQDIEQIAAWGFNSVRLPFHYELLFNTETQQFSSTGFDLISTLIGWCAKNRLYVILDMHCAPGGQNKDNISDSDGVAARLWTQPESQANQDLTVRIWTEIARRYARETWVLGYDLLNEPVMPTGMTNAPLRSLYARLATEIRKVDQVHILFIEGSWYATDFSLLEPPFDSNMVYSFHKYWNQTNQASIQNYLGLRDRTSVPIWLGESGENSNPWFYETVQLMEENNIGWCWWTHKKIDTVTSPLSAPISPAYQRVIDYWNGTADQPSFEQARDGLMSMADSLAIANCVLRPDVVRALVDQSFGAARVPFKAREIPGTIDAVDFDFGTEGVAYHDAVSKRTQYDGNWTAWNMGWQLRNDGVDIEKSTDPEGAAFNVGWIEDGEWLSYSLNVPQSGVFHADVRVASSGGGVFKLLLDDQPLGGNTVVASTGGWQNWNWVTVPSLSVTAGSHVLKLQAVVGGFNLNRIRFRAGD